MHHLDRTLNEFESELGDYESGDYEFEFETAGEGEWEAEGDFETVFDEVEEMELAASLLEITDERELDQFLGKLIKKAGALARSPAGRMLGGVLKNVARKALPIAGAALGNMIVPGVGGMVGGKLASAAGRMFGLELEGMSPQDQEFEVARRFVRLAGAAARQVAQNPTGGSPEDVAKNAVLQSARRHAPGLVRGASGDARRNGGAGGRSGRWVRRGRRIILIGV